MITRRRLFQSGLLAFFAGLLPGKSKAADTPNIKCGDRLRIVGLDCFCCAFDGIVHEITIRESLHGTELMLYSLIAVDCFPPKSWAYPGYDNSAGIHFRNGCWTRGVTNHSLSVKKIGEWHAPKAKNYDEAVNPIHPYGGKWWFHNETWSDRIGPFDTEEEASTACTEYAKNL